VWHTEGGLQDLMNRDPPKVAWWLLEILSFAVQQIQLAAVSKVAELLRAPLQPEFPKSISKLEILALQFKRI
jgi:hypothetical protein